MNCRKSRILKFIMLFHFVSQELGIKFAGAHQLESVSLFTTSELVSWFPCSAKDEGIRFMWFISNIQHLSTVEMNQRSRCFASLMLLFKSL